MVGILIELEDGMPACRHPDCMMKVTLSDSLLLSVEKPARYTGNEWNMVRKDPESVDIRFAFCFPDTYEVGMSHLGMKILYHIVNKREDAYCERVFAPWTDMEDRMRADGLPLFSLETKSALCDFDIVGFTLQYEMSYTNILNMLDLGRVPLLSRDRGEDAPFVIAGGPCAVNPEPLADFIDLFMIGEGEEALPELLDCWKAWKARRDAASASGLQSVTGLEGTDRTSFLLAAAQIPGVYVPSFYAVAYNEDGTLASVTPNREGVPARPTRRIIRDLDSVDFPTDIIVPYIGTVHDRIMLELFRGCIRGCRFCQAGFIYRPVRERSPERLVEIADCSMMQTGYEDISLVSLSTSDYSKLTELSDELIRITEERKVGLSLPSLRIDNFSLGLMEKVSKVRKSGLTFAPEAGTQRLRDVINKGVTDENLITSVAMAVAGGWNSVKLYFMMGLPTETMEDIHGIAEKGWHLLHACKNLPDGVGSNVKLNISVSCFVPKPFTPFQWEPQDTLAMFDEKQQALRDKLRKNRKIELNWHEAKTSHVEAVLARGDRRLGAVLLAMFRAGSRFDSWGEHFQFDRWMAAMAECGLDPAFYATRRREFTEVLPWDHIDIGVSRAFLEKECRKAYEGSLTRNCANGCMGCGAARYGTGVCLKSPENLTGEDA